jgi:hypothetical protein
VNNPKFQIAPEFMRRHFMPDDRLCVAMIRRKESGVAEVKQEFMTAREAVSERMQAHLRGANVSGADIYVSANTLRDGSTTRTKADIAEVRHLYLDVDSGGRKAVEAILAADGMPRPHTIVETSPDRHQLFWQVEQFKLAEAEQWMKGIARQHGADPAATDASRFLRVPGFRNCKYQEPHYVRDVTERFGARGEKVYQPEDFPVPVADRQPLQDAPQFGDRVSAQRTGSIIGKCNENDYAFACRALERGWNETVIAQRIANHRRDDGKHPNLQNYAERTVKAAKRKVATQPSVSRPQYTGSDRSR